MRPRHTVLSAFSPLLQVPSDPVLLQKFAFRAPLIYLQMPFPELSSTTHFCSLAVSFTVLTFPNTTVHFQSSVLGLTWPHHFLVSARMPSFFVRVTLLLIFLAYINLRIIYCEAAWMLSSTRPGIIPIQFQTPLLPTAPCWGRCLTGIVDHHCLFSKPYTTWFPNTKWTLQFIWTTHKFPQM